MLILTCGICEGQNLVSNPSFEDSVQCPNNFAQISYAVGWSGFSTEYFNSCNPSLTQMEGFQSAATGQGFAGLIIYMDSSYHFHYREFVQTTLTTPLIPGVKYYASLKTSLAGKSIMTASNLGLLFSTHLLPIDTSAPNCNCSQVYFRAIINDTLNWTIISGSFIADSAYQYVRVGNFFDNAHTAFTGSSSTAYYFVDDICVSTDSLACSPITGINPMTSGESNLFPNPFCNLLNIQSRGINTVILYDITSKELLRKTIAGTATINTEQLSRGIYYYEIRNTEGTVSKGKVVKQ